MKSAFSERIDELVENFDLESWLDAEGIDYKITHGRSGTQLNVRSCPVCGSDSFKVYLNAETGLGSCFAGSHPPGENFNKMKFVRAHLGLSLRDALAHVEAFVAGSVWRPKPAHVAPAESRPADKVRLPNCVTLPISGRNLQYLTARNISIEATEHFGLLYCHQGRYEFESLGKKAWQDYSGRVLIPVHNLDGEMVTFQGRDITGTKERRYIFPPGAAATGQLLYNGHRARGAARVVVNEGAFDVIATWQALRGDVDLGDIVPVGTFGKHLSSAVDGQDQLAAFIELRRAGLKEVIMMWDSEPQAIVAALDAAVILKQIGLQVRLALLPDGRDPNEVDAETVRKTVHAAQPVTLMLDTRIRIACAAKIASPRSIP